MNSVVTSHAKILETSRGLIRRRGWSAISIRSVAAACGVSVGSIYNYFPSKAALERAVMESIWREIFSCPEDGAAFPDTLACVTWIYERMEWGCRNYPGFFPLHSLGFTRERRSDGREKMVRTWRHILDELCAVLKRDPRVRPDAFTAEFTAEQFAEVLFSLMLSAFLRQSCNPSAVLEIVRRTLYATQGQRSELYAGDFRDSV